MFKIFTVSSILVILFFSFSSQVFGYEIQTSSDSSGIKGIKVPDESFLRASGGFDWSLDSIKSIPDKLGSKWASKSFSKVSETYDTGREFVNTITKFLIATMSLGIDLVNVARGWLS